MKTTKTAIIGNFTAQQIHQKIINGERIIQLGYYFSDVPADFCDAKLTYTGAPRIAWDSEEEVNESELLDQLHDATEQDLNHRYISNFIVGSGGEIMEQDLEEDQIGFYFERLTDEA